MAGPIVPLIFTVVQTVTPTEVYGRVFGALQSLSAALAPFVIAIVGFVIEGAGLVPTIVALGVVYLIVTLGMLLNPALRRLDTDRTAPPPGRPNQPSAEPRLTRPGPQPERRLSAAPWGAALPHPLPPAPTGHARRARADGTGIAVGHRTATRSALVAAGPGSQNRARGDGKPGCARPPACFAVNCDAPGTGFAPIGRPPAVPAPGTVICRCSSQPLTAMRDAGSVWISGEASRSGEEDREDGYASLGGQARGGALPCAGLPDLLEHLAAGTDQPGQ